MFQPGAHPTRRAIIERDFQQDRLHEDHEDRLREERDAIIFAEPVEDPAGKKGALLERERERERESAREVASFPQLLFNRKNTTVLSSYLRIDATSMMRGMSREKPSLDLERWIAMIWSA